MEVRECYLQLHSYTSTMPLSQWQQLHLKKIYYISPGEVHKNILDKNRQLALFLTDYLMWALFATFWPPCKPYPTIIEVVIGLKYLGLACIFFTAPFITKLKQQLLNYATISQQPNYIQLLEKKTNFCFLCNKMFLKILMYACISICVRLVSSNGQNYSNFQIG